MKSIMEQGIRWIAWMIRDYLSCIKQIINVHLCWKVIMTLENDIMLLQKKTDSRW